MTTIASSQHASGPMAWLHRSEAWLDRKGKAAWIVAMVLAFIFFWPVGLALLAYMIWSGKMACSTHRHGTHRRSHMHMSRSTGNSAFDAYRNETLRRLEEEQDSFETFLDRLRKAKDKAEFDQFMDDRASAASTSTSTDTDTDTDTDTRTREI